MKGNKAKLTFFNICLPGGICLDPPSSLKHLTFEGLISGIVILTFITAILFSLFKFITGGILWITSAGEKNKIEKAKGQITYAVLGLILLFSAFLIVNIITSSFGM